MLRAFFQESRDVGNPEVLAALAAEASRDPDEFRRALRERQYAPRVRQLLRHGMKR